MEANLGKKVWAEDEARFGLRTWHRRRWMAYGFRPEWLEQHRYEWFYLYGAIEPVTGRAVFGILPDTKKESVKGFLEKLKGEVKEEQIVLVWDRSGSHRWLKELPEGIEVVFLPPYSPELNPVEPIWRR